MVFFSRRFCLLLRTWAETVDRTSLQKYVPSLCALLSNEDLVTQYGAVAALKRIVKLDRENTLPLTDLLGVLVSAVIRLCEKVSQPNLLWPVLSILTNVMEKLSISGDSAALELLGRLNLERLLENNDMLIRSALIDMFKAAVIAVPFGTPLPAIFEASLRFLSIVLPRIETYETEQLSFWHFVVKEMPNHPLMDQAKGQHFSLLNSALPHALQKLTDPTQVDLLLNVLEESLLLSPQNVTIK